MGFMRRSDLDTWKPTQVLALAFDSSGARVGHATMVFDTRTRPEGSRTHTLTGLKPRAAASFNATFDISSAAASVSTGVPGTSQAPDSA